ncbi:Arc family DNA-binding protein [Nitratireductor rhodophyticola]|uniref:Arc family DNA-binding protein n=1 Tax=Nitratireductor rhodophyticola TaxID=2854036 RepID=UPI00300B102D
MAREDPHFRLRIPEDLKEKIAEIAVANERSMTAEIIERLRDSLERWPQVRLPNDLMQKALETLPAGTMKPLEDEIQSFAVSRTVKAIRDHEFSQSDLLRLFEEAIRHAPKEQQTRLRHQLEYLLLQSGILGSSF